MQPTAADPGDELVEWVDEFDRVIEIASRARMRRENLRHRSAAVVVLSSDGRLLVHRRSEGKDLRPGWWDVCASGVVGVGETYLEAATRELAEEIGGRGVTLEPLGVGRFGDDHSCEISHLYRTIWDGPYVFADGEVAEARLVTRAELRALMATEQFLPTCDAMVLPLVAGFEPG